MDPLEQVLVQIRDGLHAQGVEGRAGGGADQLRDALREYRGGSRYAAPGATEGVVDALANGGSVQQPQQQLAQRGMRQGQGLAALMTKALAEATPSAGGWLVPPEVSSEVVTMLRARSAVFRMGPRVIPVKKELDVTSFSTGAAAYWVAENAQIPVSEQTFAQQALLRPKELAALVPISNRLLRDADNPAADEIIQNDLAEVMALRADLAFIRGTGASNEPVGIRNTSGLTPAPNLGANGATPTFDQLKDMVAALRAVNAPFRQPGWVFNARLLSTLEKVKDNDQRYLADAGLLTFDPTGGGGRLLGYPFATTSQVPVNITTGTSTDTSEIYFASTRPGGGGDLRLEPEPGSARLAMSLPPGHRAGRWWSRPQSAGHLQSHGGASRAT